MDEKFHLHAQTPEPEQATQPEEKPERGIIARMWTGDVPLVVTYWGFCVFGIFVLIKAFEWFLDLYEQGEVVGILWRATLLCGVIIVLAYFIWVEVGLWRSAGKYEGHVFWKVVARMCAIGGALRFVWELYVGLQFG